MTIKRTTIHWALIVVLAIFGLMYEAGSSQEGYSTQSEPDDYTVIANNLTNPRGFAWGADGTMFLALAGSGGEDQLVAEGTPTPFFPGASSSIVTIADGCPDAIAEGLPSFYREDFGWTWGVMDVAVLDGDLFALSAGFGQPDTPNGVYRVLEDGSLELVADLAGWSAENPPEFTPWDYVPDGSWFDLEAGDGVLWVSEAVGGRVLTVTPDGEVTEIADLSVDHMVPTGLALDGEGGVYVGYETTVPYPDGASKITHVAADGTATDYLTGLTAVTDIAMGPDGMLYISEMATDNLDDAPYLNPGSGRVVREDGMGGFEEIVTDIDYPVYLGFDADGALYLTTPAFGAERGQSLGKVVQIDTTAAPVSLDGIQNVTPTCLPSSGTTDTAAEVAVVIEGFAFNEATIEVAAGTTVTWTNNDTTPHTVTSADGTFDSGRLDGGATFSFTFTEPGEYAYACEFHPGMQGTIVVTD